MKSINTVEEEVKYFNRTWTKLESLEKITLISILFLYIYFVICTLAAYDSLTKSSQPDAGKVIWYMILLTAVIMVSPVIAHYLGISTFQILHVLGLIGVILFVVALWILFENFEKRELDPDAYKDPYSMALYFLLVSFSMIYIFGSISRKL